MNQDPLARQQALYRLRFEGGLAVPVYDEAAPASRAEQPPVPSDHGRIKLVGGALVAIDPKAEALEYQDAVPASESSATELKATTESIAENLEARVSKIVNSITQRGARGRFPQGTTITTNDSVDPLVINYNRRNNSTNFGDREDILNMMGGVMHLLTDRRRDAGSLHYMMMTPLTNEDLAGTEPVETVVTYFFDSNFSDEAGLRANYVLATFIMPFASGVELQELVASNPDAAETFFQSAASGLHGTDVARRAADKVVLLDGKVFAPTFDEIFYNRITMQRAYEDAFIGQYSYSRTYGAAPGGNY